MSEAEVLIRREGRAGRITLNRPRALNALTLCMVRAIWPALLAWIDDPAVAVVIFDGAGDRGLCAGGDVVTLYKAWAAKAGDDQARAFWSEEYRLNALIGSYPKPFVALMDGFVIGGGIGLSAHAKGLRVVTERSRVSFPETTIGLIPDVGGTWLLSRPAAAVGNYVGLMGPQLNGAQALALGFADMHVAADRLPALVDALQGQGAPPAAIVARFASLPPGDAEVLAPGLCPAFGKASVEEIQAALAASPDERAAALAHDLDRRSPLALKVTLEAIRRARALPSLEAALVVEYRLCLRLYNGGEFPEGIRALLVDKDRNPRWTYAKLDDVTTDVVAGLFAPFAPSAELQFH